MNLHKGWFIIASIAFCWVIFFSVTYGKDNKEIPKPELKFRKDGTFKIVQFTDSQDGPDIDVRTLNLMNKILDFEKPDLVVLTGDNIDGRSTTSEEVKKSINNIAGPMERRKIPWAVVFGNHDDEHGKMSKAEMMNVYTSYPNNISQTGFETLDRVGNYNILIKASKRDIPIFNIYMLDSGKYNQTSKEYDWIDYSQIDWYKHTSEAMAEKYNKVIPSLMFFHIPIPEFKTVWESGSSVGFKNEKISSPSYNSGLFKTLLDMKDVKGIFVGHDHLNDFTGELDGIKLGYSRSIGYGAYGDDNFSRGARVFLIKESDPSKFETWMRLASDFKN
ncbi:Ser/Thr phosphatase family protein [Clostridiales bacterium oral taxon 876 str. F0540]|nr:Ser/Thr phosphatase family protein [Clostridiales bacterium oral taxon 876 str. F0540]